MLHENTSLLLRALSAPAPPSEPRAKVLSALAAALLESTECVALEVWLEEGAQAERWRFARDEAPQGAPEIYSLGDLGELADRVATAVGCAGEIVPGGQGGRWTSYEALLPFAVTSRIQGVLRLERAAGSEFDVRGAQQAGVLARALGSKLEHLQAQAALVERVKELTCVYRIAQIAAEPGPLDEALEQIVRLLPSAWQEPEATSARISIGDAAFRSPRFRECSEVLRAPILREGRAAGWVEVFHDPCDSSSPFLLEEQQLIDAVARELTSLVERKEAEADRARLQAQVHHADRLATIGLLAAGVAHELNEPLASILGFAQLASKAPELEVATRDDLGRVVTAALYARDVIRNLLVFSRQSPQRRVEVEVEAALGQAIALVEPRCAAASVSLSLHLPEVLPRIQADPAQLQQVFLNLLVNAVQAMPEGGELNVAVRHVKDGIHLEFRDTGTGIPPEDLDQVFLPFFTTKDVGEGTGIGLSVVHGIVTSHAGTLKVTSEVGRGTCFEVVFPCTRPGAGPA